MSTKKLLTLTLLAICLSAAAQAPAPGASAMQAASITGLAPDRRPDGAPAITRYEISPEQRAHALTGVEQPVPANVEAAVVSGAWWIPLRQPGMPPPYSPRDWPRDGAPAASAASATQ